MRIRIRHITFMWIRLLIFNFYLVQIRILIFICCGCGSDTSGNLIDFPINFLKKLTYCKTVLRICMRIRNRIRGPKMMRIRIHNTAKFYEICFSSDPFASRCLNIARCGWSHEVWVYWENNCERWATNGSSPRELTLCFDGWHTPFLVLPPPAGILQRVRQKKIWRKCLVVSAII